MPRAAANGGGMPGIEIQRLIEWSDTDASGHVHNGIAGRLLEAAEAELLRGLGFLDLLPSMPRVRLLFEFRERLWFGQRVTVRLRVTDMGRTSLTWALTVTGPGGAPAITGEAVVVHAPGPSPEPWPEAVRAALAPTSG